MSANGDQTWTAQALCADIPSDQLFVQGAAQYEVRSTRFGYPVCIERLADALDSRASLGVWGGLTEQECRVMLHNYLEVKSWEKWLREAGDILAGELCTKYVPHTLAHVRASKHTITVKIG